MMKIHLVLLFFSFIDGIHAQTFGPTSHPTIQPSQMPTSQPSSQPSIQPSMQPSQQPTRQPTNRPTIFNTNPKAKIPTGQPSRLPTTQPSRRPSRLPSSRPTSQPSKQPICRPSGRPTSEPRSFPSSRPTMYVASPPKPTNGDITLATAVVQTITTISGISAPQVALINCNSPSLTCLCLANLFCLRHSHAVPGVVAGLCPGLRLVHGESGRPPRHRRRRRFLRRHHHQCDSQPSIRNGSDDRRISNSWPSDC